MSSLRTCFEFTCDLQLFSHLLEAVITIFYDSYCIHKFYVLMKKIKSKYFKFCLNNVI